MVLIKDNQLHTINCYQPWCIASFGINFQCRYYIFLISFHQKFKNLLFRKRAPTTIKNRTSMRRPFEKIQSHVRFLIFLFSSFYVLIGFLTKLLKTEKKKSKSDRIIIDENSMLKHKRLESNDADSIL